MHTVTVTVACDRCGRPGWRLEVSEINGDVVIDGGRIGGGDTSPYWATVLRGRRAHRYQPAEHGTRPGAFILPADGPAGYGTRDKLVCIGRRHPRYERVVTRKSAERAYTAAVAAGRARIRLSEMSARP
jgi:hypothetical protein